MYAKKYYDQRQQEHFDYNSSIEVPSMLRNIDDVKNKTILDIGCGFGDHAQRLIAKGARKILGIDASSQLISLAKSKKIPRTEFMVCDMDKKLPLKDKTFDIVYSSLAIHYSKNINKLFREINRVLRDNGLFLFSTGHPIFNMTMLGNGLLIGSTRQNNKRVIHGNYFDESLKSSDLGFAKMRLHTYTFETLIKACTKNGFEILDYEDMKPLKSTKNDYPEKYELTTRLPTFILFKLKKKQKPL